MPKTKKKTDADEIEEFLSANPPPEEAPEGKLPRVEEPVKGPEEDPVQQMPEKTKKTNSAGKPYSTLEYAGRPLYRCKQCPYDAFQVETVLEHIRTRHMPEAPEPTVLVADKRGKPVKGN